MRVAFTVQYTKPLLTPEKDRIQLYTLAREYPIVSEEGGGSVT